MKSTSMLTWKDTEELRRKKPGTNGKSVTVTEQEVNEMQKHLSTIYTGRIQITFAEKIVLRNKEY